MIDDNFKPDRLFTMRRIVFDRFIKRKFLVILRWAFLICPEYWQFHLTCPSYNQYDYDEAVSWISFIQFWISISCAHLKGVSWSSMKDESVTKITFIVFQHNSLPAVSLRRTNYELVYVQFQKKIKHSLKDLINTKPMVKKKYLVSWMGLYLNWFKRIHTVTNTHANSVLVHLGNSTIAEEVFQSFPAV